MNRNSITILMPCRSQKPEFLEAALRSVCRQTSPHWKLLVIVAEETDAAVVKIITDFDDARISVCLRRKPSFAGALNTGMETADTEFVGILLSDDLLHSRAVETMREHIERFPDADFFHSSTLHTDAEGRPHQTFVHRIRENFELSDFWNYGSPVKHFMCWRRLKGLEIGGMDEELSLHGCDDYDFPWRMAEAGARFKAIPEKLYIHRIHSAAPRLTTTVSIADQVRILKKMFTKHGVSEEDTKSYIERALNGYLVQEKLLPVQTSEDCIRKLFWKMRVRLELWQARGELRFKRG